MSLTFSVLLFTQEPLPGPVFCPRIAGQFFLTPYLSLLPLFLKGERWTARRASFPYTPPILTFRSPTLPPSSLKAYLLFPMGHFPPFLRPSQPFSFFYHSRLQGGLHSRLLPIPCLPPLHSGTGFLRPVSISPPFTQPDNRFTPEGMISRSGTPFYAALLSLSFYTPNDASPPPSHPPGTSILVETIHFRWRPLWPPLNAPVTIAPRKKPTSVYSARGDNPLPNLSSPLDEDSFFFYPLRRQVSAKGEYHSFRAFENIIYPYSVRLATVGAFPRFPCPRPLTFLTPGKAYPSLDSNYTLSVGISTPLLFFSNHFVGISVSSCGLLRSGLVSGRRPPPPPNYVYLRILSITYLFVVVDYTIQARAPLTLPIFAHNSPPFLLHPS